MLAADEIRAALHLTRRSAEFQLGFARQLVVDYPQVWEALQSGLLDVPRAMVIVDQTSHLESEVRNRVVSEAMNGRRVRPPDSFGPVSPVW